MAIYRCMKCGSTLDENNVERFTFCNVCGAKHLVTEENVELVKEEQENIDDNESTKKED